MRWPPASNAPRTSAGFGPGASAMEVGRAVQPSTSESTNPIKEGMK